MEIARGWIGRSPDACRTWIGANEGDCGYALVDRRGLVPGRDPGHFTEPVFRETLRLPFFDGLQHETGQKFGWSPSV